MEICTYPFKTPKSLPIRSKSIYRTSMLDDLLERSVSRACNRESCNPDFEKRYHELEVVEKEYGKFLATQPSPMRKSSMKYTSSTTVPGNFPLDTRSKHLSDSSLSTWSGTSDFSGYSGTTYINPQRPRQVRPASSIGSSMRRSPLSTMRYVHQLIFP